MKGAKQFKLGERLEKRMIASKISSSEAEHQVFLQRCLRHYKKAAWAGHAAGQYNYSLFFDAHVEFGDYYKRKCLYWLRKAAAQNYAPAVNNLAFYTDKGWACNKDPRLALTLYKKAGKLGSHMGKKNYRAQKREMEMNPDQLRLRDICGCPPWFY